LLKLTQIGVGATTGYLNRWQISLENWFKDLTRFIFDSASNVGLLFPA
jgi:hypothetical protein